MGVPLQQVLQDKDFMAAPDDQKVKYLSSLDKDFAKAAPDQQKAYLAHITGGQEKPLPNYPSGQQAKVGDIQHAPGTPIGNVNNPGAGSDFNSGQYLTQQPGETTSQFVQRGAHAKVTPQDIQSEHKANVKNTPIALGTALTAGAVSPVGLAAAASSPAATLGAVGLGTVGSLVGKYGTQAAGGGEAAQNWGELGGGLLGSVGGGMLGPKAQRGVGGLLHNREGEITKLIPTELGKSIAGTLFPEPENTRLGRVIPQARDEMYNDLGDRAMERGKAQDALERQDMQNRTLRAVNDPMQQKGTALMQRGIEQARLDKANAPKGLPKGTMTPFGTSTSEPGNMPMLEPLNPVKQVGATSTTGPEVKIVGEQPKIAPTRPQPRSIILPGEEVDPIKVKSAGSAAQATAEDLYRLSEVGDKSATDELIRRRLPVRRGEPTRFSHFPLPKGGQ